MKRYHPYSDFLKEHFTMRVQKLPIDAGFTCPNRDGQKGTGGCIYCNNQSFNTSYCHSSLSVTEQLMRGKRFFSGKYANMKYLAYFQSHTGTYASIDRLAELYEEALNVADVEGIVIATRPDCVNEELLLYLKHLQRRCFVMLEYGVETFCDGTLKLVNRCHDSAASKWAIRQTHAHDIPQCVHLILGLPGETTADMLHTVDELADLPVEVVKFHQLQVIKGTPLEKMIHSGVIGPEGVNMKNFTLEQYLEICGEVISHLPPLVAIERFVSESPYRLLISPKWGVKPDQFKALLDHYLQKNDIFQGKMRKKGN